jgi:hypothetical protein
LNYQPKQYSGELLHFSNYEVPATRGVTIQQTYIAIYWYCNMLDNRIQYALQYIVKDSIIEKRQNKHKTSSAKGYYYYYYYYYLHVERCPPTCGQINASNERRRVAEKMLKWL